MRNCCNRRKRHGTPWRAALAKRSGRWRASSRKEMRCWRAATPSSKPSAPKWASSRRNWPSSAAPKIKTRVCCAKKSDKKPSYCTSRNRRSRKSRNVSAVKFAPLRVSSVKKPIYWIRRDSEIDTFMAKVSALTQERAEFASDRDKSERLVQEELREKNVLLQAKESSIGEMEGQLTAKVQSLEHQLAEKQKLLESSGAELGELRSQIYCADREDRRSGGGQVPRRSSTPGRAQSSRRRRVSEPETQCIL